MWPPSPHRQRDHPDPNTPQRGKLGITELIEMHQRVDITQSVNTKIRRTNPSRIAHTIGEHTLTPVSDRHHPCCQIHGPTEVVAAPLLSLAGVETDAHRQRRTRTPVNARERVLERTSTLDARAGSVERRCERVPGRREDMTIEPRDRRGEQRVVET